MTWIWAVRALALFGIATPILLAIAGTRTRVLRPRWALLADIRRPMFRRPAA